MRNTAQRSKDSLTVNVALGVLGNLEGEEPLQVNLGLWHRDFLGRSDYRKEKFQRVGAAAPGAKTG